MGLLVILNNYMHDLAAGTWLAANAFRWALVKRHAPLSPEMADATHGVDLLAAASLVYVIVGGLIRLAAFGTYEMSEALAKGQGVLLGFKHALFILAIVAGEVLRRRTKRLGQAPA
ncbi:MAG: hypothetical protein C4521_11205 [Actinobacteria bacterium]|nr:MAG: hypothetical protein C4521_11205 [Actinomycetota bacterium]